MALSSEGANNMHPLSWGGGKNGKKKCVQHYPGRGGQTDVTPDQTSFERTHDPGALELHGLGFERTFVWTMVWNLPDQRPLCSGTV